MLFPEYGTPHAGNGRSPEAQLCDNKGHLDTTVCSFSFVTSMEFEKENIKSVL